MSKLDSQHKKGLSCSFAAKYGLRRTVNGAGKQTSDSVGSPGALSLSLYCVPATLSVLYAIFLPLPTTTAQF